MNQRQKKILSTIIEEYTATAIPVGSEVLAKKYNLKVSSATIRNDMNELEKEGLLYQPHISSGRIPTDKGRLEKFKDEVCLLRQPYIRDENNTVENLLHQNVGSIGENIIIRRFVRWELGKNASS